MPSLNSTCQRDHRAAGIGVWSTAVAVVILLFAGSAQAVSADLPYVDALQAGEASSAPPRLVLGASAKLELVMIVSALADQQRQFMRTIAGNNLGVYWTNNTRQFALEPAPEHLQELRAGGLWGDRLLELAMHLSDPPALKRVVPWSDALLAAAGGSDEETPAAHLDRFVDELRDFAMKCRFEERWSEKQADYLALEKALQTNFDGQDPLAINTAFWGVEPSGDYHLILSSMVQGGHQAAVVAGGRTHHFMAFGPAGPEVLGNTGFLHHLVHHELSHPLVDPVLAAHETQLDASDQLWFVVSSQLSGQRNVLTWNDCIGEHLLRAYNIRLRRDDGPVLAEIAIGMEQASGYLYTREFIEVLDAYDADRERSGGLTAFIPEMSSRLVELAKHHADLDPRMRPPEFTVANRGFEGDGGGWLVKDWTPARAGTVGTAPAPRFTEVSRDATTAAHGGDAAVRFRVTEDTRDLVALEQGPLAVRAGGTVRISGWVKTEGVERQGSQQRVCGLYVLFLGSKDNVLSRGETDSAIGTVDWSALSGEFVAPPGTVHARMGMLLGMSGTAWFDDLNFERLD